MPNFIVPVTRDVTETANVEVVAATPERAAQIALTRFYTDRNSLKFELDDCVGGEPYIADLDSIEEVSQSTWERDGWAIANADGSGLNDQGNWPLQLQRRDEDPMFASDQAAHRHVVDGAKAGSAKCIAALQQLRKECRPELGLVYFSHIHPLKTPDYDDLKRTTDYQLDCIEQLLFQKVLTNA